MFPQPRPFSTQRRGLLLSAPLLVLPGQASRAQTSAIARPILDEPMRRLRLPKNTVGRDYVLLQLRVGGRGPFDFMVDTGLTAELITPHLRQVLGIPPAWQRIDGGLGAGGAVGEADLVQLTGARLASAEAVELPPLTAVVTDFLQEHMDPEHDPVEGMLGMEFLQLFDVDFDFPAGRLRLFPPGEGVAAAQAAGLVEVPAAVLNETGILGIRATSPAAQAGTGAGAGAGSTQPFVGIVDCGASFSAINWRASALAGMPPRGDAAYNKGGVNGGVAILGIDGKPQLLPMAPLQLTFVGDVHKEGGGGGGMFFDPPPPRWRPWEPVVAAVGDLPVFAQLLGDGRTPYTGPAALVGLDVLAQRRVVFGAGAGARGRARRLFVGAA